MAFTTAYTIEDIPEVEPSKLKTILVFSAAGVAVATVLSAISTIFIPLVVVGVGYWALSD
jgi:hypothetical protein